MIFSPEKYSSQNHACTLNTIVAIEQFISENSGLYTKTQLWNGLPKKIMYQSYKILLDYFLFTNKISIIDKKVVWNFNSTITNLNDFKSQNHSCTLNTIISVYNFISQNSGLYTKTQLWENLPKKIMYQSYKILIEYLSNSKLITIENRKVKTSNGGGLK